MTRADWQEIAEEKLLAVPALLSAGNWPSAYYLAGYAVESGLKACIIAFVATNPEVIFLDKRFSERCWTHGIEELVKLARLDTARDNDYAANPTLMKNWLTVANWDEKSRYQMKKQIEAEGLYNAIADNANGVMQWIKARW